MTSALMFLLLVVLIFSGFPVAFSLISVAFVFGLAEFGQAAAYQFSSKLIDLSSSYILIAIPLFVFMGAIMERAGLADDMFNILIRWLGRMPGGVGLSAIVLCVIFAASSGVSGATEAIVGMLAIPAMQRERYPKELISGLVCAGGSLGTIIPPSVLTLVLAPTAGLPVLDLFRATIVPGLLLALAYAIYLVVRCLVFHPETWKASLKEAKAREETGQRIGLLYVLKAFVPPILLIFLVLGSILNGIATATEAAALGAGGAIVIAAMRAGLSKKSLIEAAVKTVQISCMILLILYGGSLFSTVFVTSGGLTAIDSFFVQLNAGPTGVLFIILGITFLLGFVLDQISIILIVIALAMPIVTKAGIDPVWFSVLFMIALQTSYLTPPMAPAIFFFKAIAPKEITIHHMYRGVVPFIFLQLAVMGLLYAFPQLILR
jgi:tripartite ATP-independent transporter DctM subunit